jgi:hypothetical protein
MGHGERIDFSFHPPLALIPRAMVFGVMNSTQENRELIAHLE